VVLLVDLLQNLADLEVGLVVCLVRVRVRARGRV